MATSALAVQNWFETTLSGGISASDTTIGLNSVPTGSEGYLIIEPDGTTTREVIYYTSKTSNSVVLTSAANGRGVDGTTAQSHSAGATVRMQITSGYWNALQDGTAIATSGITTAKVADGAITNAKLNTTAGELGGAWQSWTPTWSGITPGDGVSDCKYTIIGKTVHCRIKFTAGSTSSGLAGTTPIFTLPVTASSNITALSAMGSFRYGASSAFPGYIRNKSTTTADLVTYAVSGSNVVDSGLNVNLANTYTFLGTLTYEAA